MEWRPRRLAACALLLPVVARAASPTPTVQWVAEATYTQCSQGTIGLELPDTFKTKRSESTAGAAYQHRWSIRVYNVGVPQDRGAVGPALTASISTPHPSSLVTEDRLPMKTTLPPKSSSTFFALPLPTPSSSSSLLNVSSYSSFSTSSSLSSSSSSSSSSDDVWIGYSTSSSAQPIFSYVQYSATPAPLPTSTSAPTVVHQFPSPDSTTRTVVTPQLQTTVAPQSTAAPAPQPSANTNPPSNGNNGNHQGQSNGNNGNGNTGNTGNGNAGSGNNGNGNTGNGNNGNGNSGNGNAGNGNPIPRPTPVTTSKTDPFGINGYGGLSIGDHGVAGSGGLGVVIGGKTIGFDNSGGLHWKRSTPRIPQVVNINKTVVEDFTGDCLNWTVNVPTGNYRLAAYDSQTGIWSNSHIFTVVDGGTSCMTAADWGDTPPQLSGGAIAGLVIGLLAGLAILASVFYILRRRKRAANRSHFGHGNGDFWRVHSNQSAESFGNLRAQSFNTGQTQDGHSMQARYELREKGSPYSGSTPPVSYPRVVRPPRPPLPDLPAPTTRAESPWDTDTTGASDRRFSKDHSTHTGTSQWPPASIHSANRSFRGGAALQPTVTGHSVAATGHSVAATAGSFHDRVLPFIDARAGVRSVAMSHVSSMATAGDQDPPFYPVSPAHTGDTVDILSSAYGGIDSAGEGYSQMERGGRPNLPNFSWDAPFPSSSVRRPSNDEFYTPMSSPAFMNSIPRHLAGSQPAPVTFNLSALDGERRPSAGSSRLNPGHERERSGSSGETVETVSTTTAHIQKKMGNMQQHRNDSDLSIARSFPTTFPFLDYPHSLSNAPGDRVSNPLSQMWSPSDGGHSEWSHWGR